MNPQLQKPTYKFMAENKVAMVNDSNSSSFGFELRVGSLSYQRSEQFSKTNPTMTYDPNINFSDIEDLSPRPPSKYINAGQVSNQKYAHAVYWLTFVETPALIYNELRYIRDPTVKPSLISLVQTLLLGRNATSGSDGIQPR